LSLALTGPAGRSVPEKTSLHFVTLDSAVQHMCRVAALSTPRCKLLWVYGPSVGTSLGSILVLAGGVYSHVLEDTFFVLTC